MVSVIFYVHIHQPYRIGRFRYFDIGKGVTYWDNLRNSEILDRVVRKSYLPTTNLLIDLMKRYDFKVSFSITGVVIEQLMKNYPQVIDNLRKIIDLGGEIIGETYYHSLAILFSKKEFRDQVRMHSSLIREVFGFKPKIFRNTELIYSNDIAREVSRLRYKGILAEGHEKILGNRKPGFIYAAKDVPLKVLLRNYRLSDDISFRFSFNEWEQYPLTADKFASWVSAYNGSEELVNLFMDFETFGEHQWHETGIFEFLKYLPREILRHPHNEFLTPSEALNKYPARGVLDVPSIVSWADTERDLSAWLDNAMQQYAISKVYELEKKVKSLKDPDLLNEWRRFQISDHYYFMCTKWFSDGDVHKYFNPYSSPYDAFINFMNALEDFKMRIREKEDKPRREALRILSDVPVGSEFYNGDRCYANLREFVNEIKHMKTELFNKYRDRGDFVNWIRDVVGDRQLSKRIKLCKTQKEMECTIKERIKELKRYV